MENRKVEKNMTQKNSSSRSFGKIILTLENCLLADNKLTPSSTDGLNKEIETDLRILGCELIQVAGILLKLPQVAMATGQVLFQRFYYSKSYIRHNMETTAMSCIYLASKIEEAPRRIRDVINVFHHIKQIRGQKPIQPVILDGAYIALKNQVIRAERSVLKELGFCVHVKHSHKLIVLYLQQLGLLTTTKDTNLMQMAWNFMNDSLRTDVFVRYSPESIACACIYLSARKLGFPLPKNPTWYGVFKVSEDDILDISYKIMSLYRRPKPSAEILGKAIDDLKKVYDEIRNKNKAEQNPSPKISTMDRNDGSHNAWGGFISRTLPLNPIAINDNKKATENHNHEASQLDAQHQPTDSVSQPNQTSQQSTSHQGHDPVKTSKNASRLPRDPQNVRQSHSVSPKSMSQSPNDNSRSRTYSKNRHRSRSRSRMTEKHKVKKQKTRNHSRSMSSSPSRGNKRRYKSDYDYGNSNDERIDKKPTSSDKHREYKQARHDRYSGRGSGSGSAGGHRLHQDRFRDRKR